MHITCSDYIYFARSSGESTYKLFMNTAGLAAAVLSHKKSKMKTFTHPGYRRFSN